MILDRDDLSVCLKLILLYFKQFSSFHSFNIWTCSCAEASLSLFNGSFWDWISPYFTVIVEKEGPAASILQTEINSLNCVTSLFRTSGPLLLDSCLSSTGSFNQHKFSGSPVRACVSDAGSPVDGVWFGAKADSKGVKGDHSGEPMTSLLRRFMFKLEDRTLEGHPSPLCV